MPDFDEEPAPWAPNRLVSLEQSVLQRAQSHLNEGYRIMYGAAPTPEQEVTSRDEFLKAVELLAALAKMLEKPPRR